MEQPDPANQPTQPLQAVVNWLPNLKRDVWILSAGQLLLFIGQGFTLVYASIYFVNQLGFSPTQVGFALGSGSISGTIGRFWAGNAVDSQRLGRRGTLLLAAAIAACGCAVLAFATTFPLLLTGNLLLGLGISLYWPATLAAITDLTTAEDRAEAFALTRLADNLGLGIGALLAGQYIALSGNYRVLFLSKGLAYLIFGAVIYSAIAETRPSQTAHPDHPNSNLQNWRQALTNRQLLTYLTGNLFFTTYAAQMTSTLPIYLANFIPAGNTETGFSEQWISYFFVWHVLLKIVLQLPITRWLKAVFHVNILLVSLVLWCAAFLLIWLTGAISSYALIPILAAFAVVALAEILYAPAATALVSEMAPESLRGVYFALESQCWAIGFLIGPSLGGWALDHPDILGSNLWLALISSAAIAGFILIILRQQILASSPIDSSLREESVKPLE